MAKYILNENYWLRTYANFPFMVYDSGKGIYSDVSGKAFACLLSCDGQTEITEDPDQYQSLLAQGLIRPAAEGDALLPEQRLLFFENNRISFLNLEITERCNYNCRHCFNAEGVQVPRAELSFAEIRNLLDECFDCGIYNVVLTGGEPTIHPDFPEIVRYIRQKGMRFAELNTNGSRITDQLLEEFRKIGADPMIKISFDGLGFHDWMRGQEASRTSASIETKTLGAIRLCIARGFRVFVQMNVNRLNLDCIPGSLEMLDEMGVYRTRLIRTTEAPRWMENIKEVGDAKGGLLSWEEYFDACLHITGSYLEKDRNMSLLMWNFGFVHSRKKLFIAGKILEPANIPYEKRMFCTDRLDVCASGDLYPCLQMSGFFKAKGFRLANIKDAPLATLLTDSPFQELRACTLEDKRCRCSYCKDCPFFAWCGGGCHAISLLSHGSCMGRDDSACIFFRDGYYEKFKALMPPDFRDKNPMKEQPDPSYLMQLDSGRLRDQTYDSTDFRQLFIPRE